LNRFPEAFACFLRAKSVRLYRFNITGRALFAKVQSYTIPPYNAGFDYASPGRGMLGHPFRVTNDAGLASVPGFPGRFPARAGRFPGLQKGTYRLLSALRENAAAV